MGIHNLLGICLAVFFVPSLVFANDVRVGVSPTTGYYEVTSKTFNVPKGAAVSSSKSVSPVVTPLSGGGFQQSMGGGITIEGLKKPAPFTARAAAGLQTMKNGAKKLARSNPARFAAGVGFAALMNSVDWVIDQGKIASTPLEFTDYLPSEPDRSIVAYRYNVKRHGSYSPAPSPLPPGVNVVATEWSPEPPYDAGIGTLYSWYCPAFSPPDYFLGYYGGQCYSTRFQEHAYIFKPRPASPVPVETIDSTIDSKYSPYAEDFVLLTPYMPPDYILVDPIPPVVTDLGVTNTFDSTGALTGTVQKTSTTDFVVSNNSTTQPSISSSTSVKTETFKDGQSQGSTVTDTSQPAIVGGGGVSNVEIDIPTDCDFMPTVCAFLDWVKNDDTPEDPDLSALIDNRDFTETYSITGGSKQCPADYEFTVDFIGRTYGLSFEPACDFASKMYYFVMAAAYIFAAYITIGASRNG